MTDRSSAMVYIVDDDSGIRSALGTLLSAHGLSSEVFASPVEFLELPDVSPRCCLVLDARLPGMTGLDLMDRLAEAGRSMPVIMITGHGDATLLNEAKKRGVIQFLKKPFNVDVLVASIEEALSD